MKNLKILFSILMLSALLMSCTDQADEISPDLKRVESTDGNNSNGPKDNPPPPPVGG
jgi:hypothetical protein